MAFIIAMIFPLLIWYFFTRDSVKAAFEGGGAPPAGPYGAGYPPAGAYVPPGPYPPQQQ